MSVSKIVAAAASGVGGAGPDVDEVFNTFLYDGTGSTHTITNNIDLSGEGGLVWIKGRDVAHDHWLFDTARGVEKNINTNDDSAQGTGSGSLQQFNSNGFQLGYSGGTYNEINQSGKEFVSWTFRKAKKFFDVVTYTGNGSARTISHNLGSVPGMIIIKQTNTSRDWQVYHRSLGTAKYIMLNRTNPEAPDSSGEYWGGTTPTATQFSLGDYFAVNQNGGTYVAYLFAHNNNDGEFGPDGDADIIKCGSYAASSQPNFINVGFEPQWLLIKNSTTNVGDWYIYDSMRGVPTGSGDREIEANDSAAEAASSGGGQNWVDFNATGFTLKDNYEGVNQSGKTYIYMAIRRGPLAAPDDATKVFAVRASTNGSGSLPLDIIPTIGFAPDWGFVIRNIINGSRGGTTPYIGTRLTGYGKSLLTDRTNAEGTATIYDFATQDAPKVGDAGGANDSGAQNIHWLWKRAPSFCDVVCYTGTGSSSARAVPHNLGVVPEMMWVKRRDSASGEGWAVYHKGLNGGTDPEDYYVSLNSTSAEANNFYRWADTAPTATNFYVTDNLDASGGSLIAYLFASVDGVSKLGSYTGNGSSQNIDCGFSSGARFVLIKNSSSSDNWYVFDSVRGIVSGNDPYLRINTALAEYTTGDHIDPYSSGFAPTSNDPSTNKSGNTYIFYAIA